MGRIEVSGLLLRATRQNPRTSRKKRTAKEVRRRVRNPRDHMLYSDAYVLGTTTIATLVPALILPSPCPLFATDTAGVTTAAGPAPYAEKVGWVDQEDVIEVDIGSRFKDKLQADCATSALHAYALERMSVVRR